VLNFNTNTLKKETLLNVRSNILGLSFMLLLIAFYPQYSSAFFHTNQMNSQLYGNFGSASSLYSNPSSLYGPNFGSMYGGGGFGMNNGFGSMMPGFGSGYGASSFGSGGLLNVLSGLLGLGSSIYGGGGFGMNNGFGSMMPGFGSGNGASSFGSGGGSGGGGMLDVFSGLLGLGSSSNQGFGSNYNFDYGYESNNNNLDYTLESTDELDTFEYDSNYGSNSDFDYGNEFQSDLPLEDLRSFDSSMDEQQYSFQDDYDFSQTPLEDSGFMDPFQ
jgi:hypothetical protein